LLSQSNEFLNFMTWKEGNLATGHKDAVEAGLPTSTLRRFYQGIAPSKGDVAIVEDVCAMREQRAEVDKDLAELGGNVAQYRTNQAMRFYEAMSQDMAQDFIYGDTATNKDGILGLTPRYNAIAPVNGVTFNTAKNIIDAGGRGSDNTSIWLVVWGDETATGIFPKGSTAGIQHDDLGIYDAFDSLQRRFRAYGEWWQVKYGLHIKDWRYVVRIANISTTDLIGQSGTQAITAATWINKLMIKALARIPSMGMGSPTFLASRTVKEMLSVGALDKSQNALSFEDAVNQFGTVTAGSVGGGAMPNTGSRLSGGTLKFMGVPVLTVDKLLSTEATVS
jgi:hypothetical protein